MKNQNSVWIALVVVIILGAGVYAWQAQQPGQMAVTDDQSMSEGQMARAEVQEGDTYESSGWERFLADVQSSTGENVENFAAPPSPSDPDVTFVSTSSNITGEWPTLESTNKIYAYNMSNGEVTKLYEEHESRTLRVMGIEGTKLILMNDLIDNSPGPCFSIWDGWEDFSALDVENPGELMPYTVPEYLKERAAKESEACVEEMDELMATNWKESTINGFTLEHPDTWTLEKGEEQTQGGRTSTHNIFYDENGEIVAFWDCPIPETGWEAWDFTEQDRQYTKDGETYEANLHIGTPRDNDTPYVTLLFMHRNELANWWGENNEEDYQFSCMLSSGPEYEGTMDEIFFHMFQSIY